MPFTYPRSELIDQDVLATIAGVTVPNGFQVNLTAAMYDPDNPQSPADLLALIWPVPDEPSPDEDTPKDNTPISHQQWYRTYEVMVYLLKSQSDSILWKTWRNLVRAEVEKAMLVDRNRGSDANGVQLAEDTYARGFDDFKDANDARGFIVRFMVKYRTQENDPYLPG